jgi:hypothetical protein
MHKKTVGNCQGHVRRRRIHACEEEDTVVKGRI